MGAMTCRRVDSGFVTVTRESVAKLGFPSSKARLRGEERKAISIEFRTSVETGVCPRRPFQFLSFEPPGEAVVSIVSDPVIDPIEVRQVIALATMLRARLY